MSKALSLLTMLLLVQLALAQKQVAITIDDVPNTAAYQANGFISPLLKSTDSLNAPIAIFINESKIYETDSVAQNVALLESWIKRDYVTVGNHTFSHLRYSKVGLEDFKNDVLKGESITRALALKEKKPLIYFRFPFNDLGSSSIEFDSIAQYLKQANYTITPFTIESSDWIFNSLYEHYLNQGKKEDAHRIASAYIDHTVSLFDYFEEVADTLFHRPVKHIYLCHDNQLNEDFLSSLMKKLQVKDYSFISLEEALKDRVYQSEVFYKGKWGFSWMYRWMADSQNRQNWMKNAPSMRKIYEEYEKVIKN
jgi:peptidoglycan/xylan/chitin deacetylase (PgdA/CDA1 family)